MKIILKSGAAAWPEKRIRLLNPEPRLCRSAGHGRPQTRAREGSPQRNCRMFLLNRLTKIKRHCFGENHHCLLDQICSAHFREGDTFECTHRFFPGSLYPIWSIIWQWIRHECLIPLQMHPSSAQRPLLPAQDTWERDEHRAVVSPCVRNDSI